MSRRTSWLPSLLILICFMLAGAGCARNGAQGSISRRFDRWKDMVAQVKVPPGSTSVLFELEQLELASGTLLVSLVDPAGHTVFECTLDPRITPRGGFLVQGLVADTRYVLRITGDNVSSGRFSLTWRSQP
ncbi:MAG: hypothetical protein AB1497_08305 [Bacillota bacterium]